jgi:hypothetical protein
MKKAAAFITALVFLAGCGTDVSELEKKVLERDPSFQVVIDTKDAMTKELAATKSNYISKKRSGENKIAAIKNELEKSRGEYVSRMERIKKKLDPEITALKNEMKIMKREVLVKNSEVSVIEKNISEIKELVQKGKNLEMTQEEMRMWNERMTSLLKKREDALRERDKMSADIETSELKIRIMESK